MDYVVIVIVGILVFVIVLLFNMSRELERQFTNLKWIEKQFDALNTKLNFVESEATKRHEIIWQKIEDLKMAILEKIK